jgi:hypothetical protein
MSITIFEKATLCEGKFVHYKVLNNQGRTPYNQTLHNSNPFSSQGVAHVICHGFHAELENVPHLTVHLSPFKLFNLVKKQRMHAHPKSTNFFYWKFLQANTWITFGQTYGHLPPFLFSSHDTQ